MDGLRTPRQLHQPFLYRWHSHRAKPLSGLAIGPAPVLPDCHDLAVGSTHLRFPACRLFVVCTNCEQLSFRRHQRESETSPFVFVSERGSPFTTAGFARMLERAAAAAGLRRGDAGDHACGWVADHVTWLTITDLPSRGLKPPSGPDWVHVTGDRQR
jgi:hypothetical protein